MNPTEILMELVRSLRAHLSIAEIELGRSNFDDGLNEIGRVRERIEEAVAELRA
jgi:hypothetical protein